MTESLGPPLCIAEDSFKTCETYVQSARWSADGNCLVNCLVSSEFRLYSIPESVWDVADSSKEVPSWKPYFSFQEGEKVYDFDLYPWMQVSDVDTCLMVTCTKDHPIFLWNLIHGVKLGSYTAYNDKDEVVAPLTVAFNLSGERIYSGHLNCLKIFQADRPGREYQDWKLSPTRRSKEGQRGLVVSIAFSPDQLCAVGSSSGLLGIYSETNEETVCLIDSQHNHGISQVAFSADGACIVTSGRKDNWITVWDLRFTGRELYHLERPLNTHQRTRFGIQGSSIVVGDQSGFVRFYSLLDGTETKLFQAHHDLIHTTLLHPSWPLLFTCSGQRHYMKWDEEDDETYDHSIRFWRF